MSLFSSAKKCFEELSNDLRHPPKRKKARSRGSSQTFDVVPWEDSPYDALNESKFNRASPAPSRIYLNYALYRVPAILYSMCLSSECNSP